MKSPDFELIEIETSGNDSVAVDGVLYVVDNAANVVYAYTLEGTPVQNDIGIIRAAIESKTNQ